MKENRRCYIISAVIVALAAILLLVFLLVPKGDKAPSLLNCNAESIQMEIGEQRTDFYTISDENAVVEFSVDKEGIIEIDEEKIVALASGEVTVEIIVSLDGQEISEYFTVNVLSKDYTLNIIPSSGCSVNGNTLTVSQETSSFTIEFLDRAGQLITDKAIEVSASDGATCTMLYGVYRLSALNDCTLTFSVAELDFSVSFNIVVM